MILTLICLRVTLKTYLKETICRVTNSRWENFIAKHGVYNGTFTVTCSAEKCNFHVVPCENVSDAVHFLCICRNTFHCFRRCYLWIQSCKYINIMFLVCIIKLVFKGEHSHSIYSLAEPTYPSISTKISLIFFLALTKIWRGDVSKGRWPGVSGASVTADTIVVPFVVRLWGPSPAAIIDMERFAYEEVIVITMRWGAKGALEAFADNDNQSSAVAISQ